MVTNKFCLYLMSSNIEKMSLSLREEIANRIKLSHTHPNLSLSYIEDADYILKLIQKRIDEMIKIDDETINRKSYTVYDEGRIAAMASKNTLILVKEMFK